MKAVFCRENFLIRQINPSNFSNERLGGSTGMIRNQKTSYWRTIPLGGDNFALPKSCYLLRFPFLIAMHR